MKKQIKNLLICLMLISIDAHSQQQFEMGPHIGAGMRTVVINHNAGFIGMGYHIGLIASVPVSKKLFLMPCVAYSLKGYHRIRPGDWIIDFSEQDLSLNYFDFNLPVAIQFNRYFYAKAGFQCAVLDKAKYSTSIEGYNGNIDGDKTEYFNSFDYGIIAGCGFKLKKGICIDAMTTFGLRNILKEEYSNSYSRNFNYDSFNGKNLLFTVSFNYLFGHYNKAGNKV